VSGPLEILLEYMDRMVADAERRSSERAKKNDWMGHALQRWRASEFQKQRDRLFLLLSETPGTLDPQKVLDTLVNSV
jgi:hypothetical protein